MRSTSSWLLTNWCRYFGPTAPNNDDGVLEWSKTSMACCSIPPISASIRRIMMRDSVSCEIPTSSSSSECEKGPCPTSCSNAASRPARNSSLPGVNALGFQLIQRFAHQVASAQRMREAGMHCSRVYQLCQSHLFYIPQPLKPGMVYHPYQLRLRKPYEPIHGVINDLNFYTHFMGCKLPYFFGVGKVVCGE